MYGIDYASVDGNARPNLPAAVASGISFVYVRGSYHTWADPDAARDRDAIRAAGAVYGAYPFFDYSATAAPIAQQVRVFKDAAGLVPGTDLIPAMDIEFAQGIRATGRTPAQLGGAILDARHALEDAYGVSPGYYSSARVLDTHDTDTLAGAADAALAGLTPWLARYAFAVHLAPQLAALGQLPPPPVPRAAQDADDWWVHQVQGDAIHVAGFSATVDVDRWHLFTALSPADGARWRWVAGKLGRADLLDSKDPIVQQRNMNGAIRMYQQAHNLTADGVIGPRSFAHLGWEK